jgi:hypothetical protein
LATFGAGGFVAVAGFGAAGGCAAGVATAGEGVAGAGGAAVIAGVGAAGGSTLAAGGGAAGFGGTAGATAAGLGKVLSTAALQAGDRLLTFFCRQANASWPRIPEHFDMASLRQFDRSALWTSLEICAVAVLQAISPKAST